MTLGCRGLHHYRLIAVVDQNCCRNFHFDYSFSLLMLCCCSAVEDSRNFSVQPSMMQCCWTRIHFHCCLNLKKSRDDSAKKKRMPMTTLTMMPSISSSSDGFCCYCSYFAYLVEMKKNFVFAMILIFSKSERRREKKMNSLLCFVFLVSSITYNFWRKRRPYSLQWAQ